VILGGMCRVIKYDGKGNTPDHIVSDQLVPWEPVSMQISFRDPVTGRVRNFPRGRRWAKRLKVLESMSDVKG